jgi:acyl-coenzyme A synthetase/AMP-(fatty) acid ligase
MVHPLGNVTGLSYVGPALAFGQPIVLLDKFELNAWVTAVRNYKPIRAALPPAGIRMVVDAKVPKEDLASLTVVGVGGTALDLGLQKQFEETYGIPILSAFGATEFGGVIASWSLDLYKKFGHSKPGSLGRAAPNCTLRIVDPETRAELPPDTVGLLEAKVGRIGPDWIRTTDLARLDADGFLYLHGRADQAINRGGFKVVPEAVATVLRTHPGVADAAVVGIADQRLGEVPMAAVEPKAGVKAPTPDDLAAFAREKLIAYQVPVKFIVLEKLPRNESMKPALATIKKMFEG